MLYSAEHELAPLLATWPAVEERVIRLYELDPTHVAAKPACDEGGVRYQGTRETRSSLPFCLLSEETPAAVLLELDPTHLHAPQAEG